jgi:hypothetical protein
MRSAPKGCGTAGPLTSLAKSSSIDQPLRQFACLIHLAGEINSGDITLDRDFEVYRWAAIALSD